jgi:hypothetical protein
MSLLKLVPAWLHGIGDYGAGLALIIVPLIVGGTDEAVYTGVVLGAVLVAVSLITRYPLGAVKALPFPVHSGGDYLGGLLAIVAPFLLGFNDTDEGLTVFYVVVGVVVIALSLVTNYQDPRVHVSDAAAEPTIDRREHRPRAGARAGAPRRVS